MECSYCKDTCIKSGTYSNGHQRYYCKSCMKYQKTTYFYKGCEQGMSEQIALLNNNSCGIRSISRILKISTGESNSQYQEKLAGEKERKAITIIRERI